MISKKFSTNPESFNEFGRGRRIDLAISGGMTHTSETLGSLWIPTDQQGCVNSLSLSVTSEQYFLISLSQ